MPAKACAMALPARRLDIARRQNWLLPGQRAAVRFFDGGRRALPAMTHHTAELVRGVRNHRVPAEWLGADIGQTGFFQSHMAGGAAIDDSQLRKPDLLDSVMKVALQRDRVSPVANQRQILLLIMAPFAEVVLSRRDGQRNQQQQADHAKSAHGMAEQRLPQRRLRVLPMIPISFSRATPRTSLGRERKYQPP